MWFLLGRFPLPLGAGMGYVILLWHSLGLPYNCFVFMHSFGKLHSETVCFYENDFEEMTLFNVKNVEMLTGAFNMASNFAV